MANDIKHVRGVVEATAQNAPDRWGVRIDRVWYDGFGELPLSRGADVEIDYVESGRFRNVQAIRVAESSDGRDPVDGRIVRAVALKAAAAVAGPGEDAQAVLARAGHFEKWLRATPE